MKDTTVEGEVNFVRTGLGSKSEHVAVCIQTENNGAFILREVNANPFQNRALENLVGKRIVASGMVHNQYLFLESYELIQ